MSNTRLFAIGVSCCILGTTLIYVGDHRSGAIWMTMVAVGVISVVVGIGVLRYQLFGGMKRKSA